MPAIHNKPLQKNLLARSLLPTYGAKGGYDHHMLTELTAEACGGERGMNAHDYRVDPLTIEQIESRALFFRAKWGLRNTIRVNVFKLLFEDMPLPLIGIGLKMVLRSAGFMGLKEAYATTKPKRIFFRGRLYSRLRLGDNGASIIFLHELGHILLHPGAPKAWLTEGYERVDYIEEERSAEWQASMFALCIKAPAHLAVDCYSAEAFQQKFGLSAEDAKVRYEVIAMRRPRKIRLEEPANADQRNSHLDLSSKDQERCPDCGTPLTENLFQKHSCRVCNRYGDKFQDGDTFGLDNDWSSK